MKRSRSVVRGWRRCCGQKRVLKLMGRECFVVEIKGREEERERERDKGRLALSNYVKVCLSKY